MITDADKQDETMELGRNRFRGNSQHSTIDSPEFAAT